jgi:hypothetical protein
MKWRESDGDYQILGQHGLALPIDGEDGRLEPIARDEPPLAFVATAVPFEAAVGADFLHK